MRVSIPMHAEERQETRCVKVAHAGYRHARHSERAYANLCHSSKLTD